MRWFHNELLLIVLGGCHRLGVPLPGIHDIFRACADSRVGSPDDPVLKGPPDEFASYLPLIGNRGGSARSQGREGDCQSNRRSEKPGISGCVHGIVLSMAHDVKAACEVENPT